MHTVEEVAAYSRELRLLLRTIGVSSGDMEKGTMRFEANVSMRPEGSQELGTRVEVKNLNSFKAMENAIIYQMGIQEKTLKAGGKVRQQTLGWDESEGITFSQRSKENANDYRYFPEPDLPPLIVDQDWIKRIRETMPELPNEKRVRYATEYKLQPEDYDRLIEDKQASDFFEAAVKVAPALSPNVIVNWMVTDLFAWLNQNRATVQNMKISPKDFIGLIALVENGTINQNTGKVVLNKMLENGQSAVGIVEDNGLQQVSDTGAITILIEKVLDANPAEIQSYIAGKETLENWFFGQVMHETKGKANPQIIKNLLHISLIKRKK